MAFPPYFPGSLPSVYFPILFNSLTFPPLRLEFFLLYCILAFIQAERGECRCWIWQIQFQIWPALYIILAGCPGATHLELCFPHLSFQTLLLCFSHLSKWQRLLFSSQNKQRGVILAFLVSLTSTINLLANPVDPTFGIFLTTFPSILWVFISMILLGDTCITNWPSCFPHCPMLVYTDTSSIWTNCVIVDSSLFHLAKRSFLVKAFRYYVISQHLSHFIYCSSLNPSSHPMVLLYFTHHTLPPWRLVLAASHAWNTHTQYISWLLSIPQVKCHSKLKHLSLYHTFKWHTFFYIFNF